MKKLALSLIVLFGLQSFAQVGIANTDPKAQLDISASNIATPANTDGILIPRVNAFPAVNPTANQNGMMVFLTTVVGSNQPGFYYWDNASVSWVGVGKNTSNAWGLTGNAGTSPATNFIGTTDGQPLMFKMGASKAGSISGTGIHFGMDAGQNLTNAGGFNSLFGASAGQNSTTGIDNTFIGCFSGASNISGAENVFVGKLAGGLAGAGSKNVSLGVSAGRLFTGDNNVAIGYFAGAGSSNASRMTMVGSNATAGGFANATAIGADASVGASNSMVLGSIAGVNGATSSVNVGIGTTTPQDRLHVAGNIRMVDGNQAAGKVLTSDANGTATWQNASANAWGLLGNSGTVPGTNFVGTSDNQDLVFRRNNVVSGRLAISNTSFGASSFISNGGFSNSAFGANTLTLNTAGFLNAAFGSGVLESNVDGHNNSGFGANALRDNVDGFYNVAVGRSVLENNISGDQNTGIGSYSLSSNTSGDNNIAIGMQALNTNTTGSFNTAIGYNSDVSAAGLTNATAFGANAQVAASNALVLGSISGFNGASVTVNVGIGTTTPADRLHVVGNIRMVDGNQASGRVLTSDANGTATWQNVSANAWGINGNAGTSSATNFIGTIDNQDVIFKRNNVLSGRLGNNSTSFGVDALSGAMLNDNTAFGFNALRVNSVGNNTAFGSRALQANTVGTDNVSVGHLALSSNSIGSNNTALGKSALGNSTAAANNVAIGHSALNTSLFSSQSTGVGYLTDVGNNSNSTAIGARAMATTSNVMVLGSIAGVNGATSSVNVGIGTTSPRTELDIEGTNVVTASATPGILNVMSNNVQGIDVGGSISLGGYRDDAGTVYRVFGTVEGRKANATSGSSDGYLSFKTNSGGILNERLRITATGDVGIGTAAPGGQFELSLNEGRKPGTNTWTIVSDARLKDVSGVYEKGLADIAQLRPVRYHYKNVGDRKFEQKVLDEEFPGFLAQEVRQIFPEAVGTDADGYLNFNMHAILIASVNAIRELNDKNAALETAAATQQEKINQLEMELQEQKRLLQSILEKVGQ
ncbi:Tail fiber domain-containing protein [Flavobacterium longum]|uniref:tail fiber domain-containing protein n=1 Tax=Flavobacterium longum TaxID=1299340 RepID=UPI0039E96464